MRSVLSGQMLQQTAPLEHLQEQMSNLQQVVKGLEDIRPLAVGVFQVQSAVLLEVKALVFDLAADPPAANGHRSNGVWAERKIGEPGKGVLFPVGG